MRSRTLLWLACIGAVAVIALATVMIETTRNTTQVRANGVQIRTTNLCDHNPKPGFVYCDAMKVTYINSAGQPMNMEPHTIGPKAAAPQGLGPTDLQSAYKVPSAQQGSGQTVAIVDAMDDPNAESDLTTYRAQFGLPACTTANGCFKKVDQNGGTNYPQANAGWAGEISLDVDMASAVCPNCHILLVEASSASGADLGASVNTAVTLGANTVSNSYGGPEDDAFAQDYNHPGTIITASSGDGGFGVSSPASYSTVVAVGGTSLSKANNARGWTETAWGGAGSGCSQLSAKPTWQKDPACAKRSVADVSAVADPATGVAVNDTFQENGWIVVGGTSASAPIIASVYALAGNANTINAASSLYSNAHQLNDVISGSNGNCGNYLCNAGPGYDGPTGMGTPNGLGAF